VAPTKGDLNFKYFHLVIALRRVRNSFNGIFINSRWCDDKDEVKDKVKDFFKNRFEGVIGPQVRLDNVFFNSISDLDN